MKSHTSSKFRDLLEKLPQDVRAQARKAYKLFKEDPYHASLHFKRVDTVDPLYSARIGLGYRVLGIKDGDEITWFWIGTHTDYDKLLK